ncbi:MAG: XRE family transcriptional regulator [Alphaproteobacteria bacterium]|mgnify:FL=1|jgi:DNA-binding helix-turn-helix protein|nr:XRE family transcriptional regulator [Alphaproteobacteria bacterium]
MKFGSWINNLFHGIECDMENDLNKYLGLRVRSLRENAQMTQEELANVCDVSWRTISNLERGCVTPDLVMICKISKKFNVGLDDLLNIEVQRRKSMSRIATENLLIERIKTIDDPTLDFVVEQLNVVFKYFGA